MDFLEVRWEMSWSESFGIDLRLVLKGDGGSLVLCIFVIVGNFIADFVLLFMS